MGTEDALASQIVDHWCLHTAIAVAADVIRPRRVGRDDYDVVALKRTGRCVYVVHLVQRQGDLPSDVFSEIVLFVAPCQQRPE